MKQLQHRLNTVAAPNETTGECGSSSPPEFDFNLPCRYFKSSFARSLSLNNANGSCCKSLDFVPNTTTTEQLQLLPLAMPRMNRISVGHQDRPEFNTINNNNNVDDGVEKPPAIPARRPHQQQQQQQQQQQKHQQYQIPLTQFRNAGNQRRSSITTTATNQQAQKDSNGGSSSSNNNNNITNQQATVGVSSFIRRNIWPLENSEQDFNFQCRHIQQNNGRVSEDRGGDIQTTTMTSATTTTTNVLQPENAHRLHPYDVGGIGGGHENNTMNVEAVLLQNQVDTLKWQLKQVETSCEMYRAVMEEVARFLDRYHSQQMLKRVQQQEQLQQYFDQQQLEKKSNRSSVGHMEQIARSKSLHHVNDSVHGGAGDGEKSLHDKDDQLPADYLRARSSTNLIDLKQRSTAQVPGHRIAAVVDGVGSVGDTSDQRFSDVNSYSAFKDFTWRRSPKKHKECDRSRISVDQAEEKLNQEAFRLSRTIHNLLNTSIQQPDLTHHRNSLVSPGAGVPAARGLCVKPPIVRCESVASSTASSPGPMIVLEHAAPALVVNNNNHHAENVPNKCQATESEMLFLRSANMRDSRLSLRSCTDSSVHSTISSAASSSSSSSKVETDEEIASVNNPFRSSASSMLINVPGNKSTQNHPFGSGTEDESGFSSISSFHDVGVPLSSTLISNAAIRGRNLDMNTTNDQQQSDELESTDARESRTNVTLKPDIAFPLARHPNNVVGLPLQATHEMHHRWDTPANTLAATKTYRNANKFQQRFSTLSNEDSATVLWV